MAEKVNLVREAVSFILPHTAPSHTNSRLATTTLRPSDPQTLIVQASGLTICPFLLAAPTVTPHSTAAHC